MAAQDISANLNLTAQRLGAGDLDALMIEKFNNVVRENVQFASITDGLFMRTPLIGTDTMSNAAFSDPSLIAVVPGVEPLASATTQGDRIVQVKTPIIARITEGMLSRVQDRLNIYGRMPGAFARILAKHIDEIQMHKCVQSGLNTASGAGAITTLPGGVTSTEAVAGDYLDADKFEKLIRAVYIGKMKQEVDIQDHVIWLTPDAYSSLLDSDKLLSSDFAQGNGNFSDAMIMKAGGFRVKPTNRLPTTVNAANIMGTAYNVSAAEAKVVACWAGPEAIMSAEAIPITSDAYWDKRLLTWFIDSYLAFGTAIDNPAYAAVVMQA